MQATSRSRRLYKLRGSRNAVQGKPRQATRLAVHIGVGEDDETDGGIVRHKLPTKKKRYYPGSDHSLQAAVQANRKASKKH